MKKLFVAALAALMLSACGQELAAYRDFDYAPQGQTLLWKRALCGAYGETEWQNVWSAAPPPSYDCYGRYIPPVALPYAGAPPYSYGGGGLVIIFGGRHHHRRR